MAAAITGRTACLRVLWRSTSSRSNCLLPASIRSSSKFQHTQISAPRSLSRFRQEPLFLSSLLPVHSAIASACLVSKLPSEASSSTEGLLTTSVPSSGEQYQRSVLLPALEVSTRQPITASNMESNVASKLGVYTFDIPNTSK